MIIITTKVSVIRVLTKIIATVIVMLIKLEIIFQSITGLIITTTIMVIKKVVVIKAVIILIIITSMTV